MMDGDSQPISHEDRAGADHPPESLTTGAESLQAMLNAAREKPLSEESIRNLLQRVALGSEEEGLYMQAPADADNSRSLEDSLGKYSHPASTLGALEQSQDAMSRPGRYCALRLHAQGGLGEVFLARDGELHREVALKTLRDRYGHDPVTRDRFLREAEITAGLEHPGIVPVYGLGSDAGGRPFYAMKFIRGHTLKDETQRFHQGCGARGPDRDPGRWTLELVRLLSRFIAVCNTIAYAHSRGVIHRDLKPANIMLGPYGETLVVDWGLAKPLGWVESSEGTAEAALKPALTEDIGETLPGSTLGTPAFMSPEQAMGDLSRIGPASDVYSLGATLYTLLTGQTPVEGRDLGETLQRVRYGDIRRPRDVDPRIPRQLEAICLRAMATEPSDRYKSAGALAEDLERWIAGEPVTAWRERFWERLGRWARRHRSSVIALLVAGVMSLTGFAAAIPTLEARRTLERANTELRAALARDEDQLGALCRKVGQTREAVAHHERAHDIWQDLVRKDPGSREFRSGLAASQRNIEIISAGPARGTFSCEEE